MSNKKQQLEKWRKVKLDELGTVERGRSRHRPRNDASLYGGDYPFIQTGDVKEANFYINKYSQTYNEKGLAQSKLWPKNTLCITIAANIAETAILKFPACFPDSIIGFLPYDGASDVRFVKYLIDTLKMDMQAVSKGTAQDNLSVEKLLSFYFYVPDFKTQQKIASILAAYDELIENNTRRIKILEELAQAVYNEWFVRFRFPGYEKVKMIDPPAGGQAAGTEFGNLPAGKAGIPEGWEVKNILDVVDVKYGKNLPTKYLDDNFDYYVYGAAKIIGKYREYNREKPTVIVGCRGSVGQFIITKPKSFVTNNSFYFDFKENEKYFYFYQLLNRGVEDCISGTAQPQITIQSISKVKLLVPPKEILNLFNKFIFPIQEELLKLDLINQNLRQARDLFLPKLVSGEVEVK